MQCFLSHPCLLSCTELYNCTGRVLFVLSVQVVVPQGVLVRASAELTVTQALEIADMTLETSCRAIQWALNVPEVLMASSGEAVLSPLSPARLSVQVLKQGITTPCDMLGGVLCQLQSQSS